jgi:putative peptidoglycan lipid II flippase
VAVANLTLNTVLYAALYRVGTWGIPLAISIANIVSVVALLVVLRRRLEEIELGETVRATVLITLASGALAGIAYVVWWGLDDVLGRSTGAQLLAVATALLAGGAVYVAACRVLGVRELQALLSLRRRAQRG